MSGFQARGRGRDGGRGDRGGGRGGGDFRGGGGRGGDFRGGGGRDGGGYRGGGRDFTGRGGGGRGPGVAPRAAFPIVPIPSALVVGTPDVLPRVDLNAQPLRDTASENIVFTRRPGYGGLGRKINVYANHYVTKFNPAGVLYQYDVAMEGEDIKALPSAKLRELMVLLQKKHSALLSNYFMAYDGRAIMYAAPRLPFESGSAAFLVELASARSRKGKGTNTYKIIITETTERRMEDLAAFLSGTSSEGAQACITALDHALRVEPTRVFAAIGRSFYLTRDGVPITGGLEIWTGLYQSLRPTQGGLTLNCEMASSAFVSEQPVVDYLCKVCNVRDPRDFAQGLNPRQRRDVEKAINTLSVTVSHQGSVRGEAKSGEPAPLRKYRISGMTAQGADVTTFSPDSSGARPVTVASYFVQKYGVTLRYPKLPCLRVGPKEKHCYLPMEVCTLTGGQRVMRLSDLQMADMIKVAGPKPDQRRANIHGMLSEVRQGMNRDGEHFGIEVTGEQVQVNGRVLEAPNIRYGKDCRKPVERPNNGTWNMRDKTFIDPATMGCWSIVSFCGPGFDINMFASKFTQMAQKIGMNVLMYDPPLLEAHYFPPNFTTEQVLYESANAASKAAGGGRPQLVVCVIPRNEVEIYSAIKIASDCHFGFSTQCVIQKNATQCNDQVLANLLLKVNGKLGGKNSVINDALPWFSSQPTIIMGADVHHPGVGVSNKPSVAAVTASVDSHAARHVASIRAQEPRLEMIADLKEMVKELLIEFYKCNNAQKPARILFLRDGVSEGQFHEVMKQEVRAIEAACDFLEPGYRPRITFIICQKRHRTRFFADERDQDRSGNVPSGLVVDTGVCHPHENDFYLCSHSGIQGTSRPAKYHVLWDENAISADELQKLMFWLCFGFMRCSRAVSLPPAVYYSHLAAFRGRLFCPDDDTSSSVSGASAQVDWSSKMTAVHDSSQSSMYFI